MDHPRLRKRHDPENCLDEYQETLPTLEQTLNKALKEAKESDAQSQRAAGTAYPQASCSTGNESNMFEDTSASGRVDCRQGVILVLQ